MSRGLDPFLKDFLFSVYTRFRRWLNQLRARRTSEWTRIDATIRSANALRVARTSSIRTGILFEWLPIVHYEYQVENTTYSGKVMGEIWCYDAKGAFDAAESLIGATLPIRYNPARPSKSFYLPQDGGPPQFLPASSDTDTDM